MTAILFGYRILRQQDAKGCSASLNDSVFGRSRYQFAKKSAASLQLIRKPVQITADRLLAFG
jgi:hypothetical protein